MGTPERNSKISFIDANMTPIMSVSLVLLLLGLVAFLGISAREATQQVKENIGFDVSMAETATVQQVNDLKKMWNASPYVASVKYISKEEGLQYWQQETGEDLMAVLGFNPLTEEFEVHVKPEYSSIGSLNKIEAALMKNAAIEEVQIHRDQVETINKNINNIAMVLMSVSVVMLIISFALINNTVRLTVYSRRFLIHTMKLVGATPGFISKPIVLSSVLNGFIAALIAMTILSGGLYYLYQDNMGDAWSELITIADVWMVFGGLMVTGMALCAVAAFFASRKFIRLDYDDLFTK